MKRLLWIFGIITLSLSSCDLIIGPPKVSIDDPKVVKATHIKLDEYRRMRLRNCRSDVYELAEKKVDSSLYKLIDQFIKKDSDFPIKPYKPPFPSRLDPGVNIEELNEEYQKAADSLKLLRKEEYEKPVPIKNIERN